MTHNYVNHITLFFEDNGFWHQDYNCHSLHNHKGLQRTVEIHKGKSVINPSLVCTRILVS